MRKTGYISRFIGGPDDGLWGVVIDNLNLAWRRGEEHPWYLVSPAETVAVDLPDGGRLVVLTKRARGSSPTDEELLAAKADLTEWAEKQGKEDSAMAAAL